MAKTYKKSKNGLWIFNNHGDWLKRKRSKSRKVTSRESVGSSQLELRKVPNEILMIIFQKLKKSDWSSLKLVHSRFTTLGRESQFQYLRCPLPCSTEIYDTNQFPGPTSSDPSVAKEIDQLKKVKEIFHRPELVSCLRSVRVMAFFEDLVREITRPSMIRARNLEEVANRYGDVPKEVFDNFVKMLGKAQHLKKIWVDLPLSIPLRELQTLSKLKVLRVRAAGLEGLRELPIRTLVLDCDDDTSDVEFPHLPSVQELSIINPEYSESLQISLKASRLPKLQMLSFRGYFHTAIALHGNWITLHVLNLVGFFRDIDWISGVANQLSHLALSLSPVDQRQEKALATVFPKLKVLELHWCTAMNFPRGASLPQLQFYSESRYLDKHEMATSRFLCNVQPYLGQLEVLALHLQCAGDNNKVYDAQDLYDNLHVLRKRDQLRHCLVLAPVHPPEKKRGWLVYQRSLNNPQGWYDRARTWNRHQERLSLLHKVDIGRNFLESRGELYPPVSSLSLMTTGLTNSWSSIFPFAEDMELTE